MRCLNNLICAAQGWNDAQRKWWYTASQGSRLLPLKWIQALEYADAASGEVRKFLSEENVSRWGYLANPASSENPYGLPLGFAIDEESSARADIMCSVFPASCKGRLMRQKWVGMNCAACHTNDIEFNGKSIRVEGAATLADFQSFEDDLLAALRRTLEDGAAFDRFAETVLSSPARADSRALLRAQLAEHVAWRQKQADANQSRIRYGHGRLDAQSHILNKVMLTAGVSGQSPNVKAEAPASYPFIWNASQQDRLQWNGIASNFWRVNLIGYETDIGALLRNTTEVIGVYAHIEPTGRNAVLGYPSSLRLANMVSLERQLATLKSPRWPEAIFGKIDREKAARGKVLFDRARCGACHKPLAWDDTTTRVKTIMTPVIDAGTDIMLACNTLLHQSKTGKFNGQRVFPHRAEKIGEEDFTRKILVNSTIGAVSGKKKELVWSLFYDTSPPDLNRRPVTPGIENYLPGVSDIGKKTFAMTCLATEHDLLAYKARPLNGIWATAPYLHNGSVPTLYDLLLPAKVRIIRRDGEEDRARMLNTRPERFGVGSRKFDPRKVGFVTSVDENPTTFTVRDEETGEPIVGNYNSGHDYGTSLSEGERYELIEYLKTL